MNKIHAISGLSGEAEFKIVSPSRMLDDDGTVGAREMGPDSEEDLQPSENPWNRFLCLRSEEGLLDWNSQSSESIQINGFSPVLSNRH